MRYYECSCLFSGISLPHNFEDIFNHLFKLSVLEEGLLSEDIFFLDQLNECVHYAPWVRSVNDQSFDKDSKEKYKNKFEICRNTL